MEVRVEDGPGIPVYEYSVFVEQEKYQGMRWKIDPFGMIDLCG